jgi:ornithine carbamoyltransferase
MGELRHLLKISDFSREECDLIIKKAIELKQDRLKYFDALRGQTLLMIFEKPSLRTRVSFETGMYELGGQAIFYSIKDSPLGRKETFHDFAKVVSRYACMVSARLFKRSDLYEIAKFADIPVINMLDDFAHPCQILCDYQTIYEKKGTLDGLKIAYFGDAYNNVTYDHMRMAAMYGLELNVACPEGVEYEPEQEVLDEIATISAKTGAKVTIMHDALKAAEGCDVLYTDSWMSYGIPVEEEQKRKASLMPFQINDDVIKAAKSDVIFMNCLPAKRGYEQTAEVIDGPHSVVFDEAENRLHVQKAIMLFLMGKI